MTGNSHCFVEWKEQFVSQERGNRVVNYFLKDSTGESIRAIVGTERSVRHMFYVVAEEFLQAYGKESSIHAGYKWLSRREVVDWLTSMLSKQNVHGDRICTFWNIVIEVNKIDTVLVTTWTIFEELRPCKLESKKGSEYLSTTSISIVDMLETVVAETDMKNMSKSIGLNQAFLGFETIKARDVQK
nr:hypothetical protein CFP56_01631 [Quercus suber]